MAGTTIKIEGDLLEELKRTKPRALSLSAYVREVLAREVRRHELTEAADRYAEWMRKAPAEQEWMHEWDRADLVTAPKRRSESGREAPIG